MSKDLAVTALLDTYGGMLTERQRDVVGYYYCDDLSLAEIAENEGITRQAVRDIIRRAVKQLGDMEHKLGFAERMNQIYAAVDLIRSAADGCDPQTAECIRALCDTVQGPD